MRKIAYNPHGSMATMPHLQNMQWDFMERLSLKTKVKEATTGEVMKATEKSIEDLTKEIILKIPESYTPDSTSKPKEMHKKNEEFKMFGKKINLMFLAFAVLQSCIFSSEKEPEELIKLKMAAMKNKTIGKVADYTMQYMYYDLMNGTFSENFNDNINEVLWKKQLRKSCDAEIFMEKESGFLDLDIFYQKYLSFLSNFFEQRTIDKTKSYSVALINDYDSLREYELSLTTESGQQSKNIESFIKIDGKWLSLSNSSYRFAEARDEDENISAELSTKKLPPEFIGDTMLIYVQDTYRIHFLGFKIPASFQLFSYELIGILKRTPVPEETAIIIVALPEIPTNPVYGIANLLEQNGYYTVLALSDNPIVKSDISSFSQDSLYKYNEKLKKKLEKDINTDFANLNRNVCSLQPVAFAIDLLDDVHILPKYVLIKPVDYEFIKHSLMRSIKLNYENLQIRKNWAYCLDLVICPEKILPYSQSEEIERNASHQDSIECEPSALDGNDKNLLD
jgi:hypothetical protein